MGQDLHGRTIRIGIGATLSGTAAPLGREMKQAVELAVAECNETGGIMGAIIETESRDDEDEVRIAVQAARGFCGRADLLGIVGYYNSDTTLAAAALCEGRDLAIVAPIASNPELTDMGLRTLFRFTNRDDHTGTYIATYLVHEFGKRQAVIVETASMYGRSMAAAFAKPFIEGGGRILRWRQVKSGEHDFAPITGSLPEECDLIFYGGSFEGATLLAALRQAGHGQLFAAGDGCWDHWNFLGQAGSALDAGEGVLVLSATPEPGHVEGSREFAKRYTDAFGPIGNYAVNSYDAARLLLAAIAEAAAAKGGMPERGEVCRCIRSMRYRGIACPGDVRWRDNGDNAAAVTALHKAEGGCFRQVAMA